MGKKFYFLKILIKINGLCISIRYYERVRGCRFIFEIFYECLLCVWLLSIDVIENEIVFWFYNVCGERYI